MAIDDVRLRDLLEQSQDLHSDAITTTWTSLDELVEFGHDERRDGGETEPTDERHHARVGALPTRGILAAAGLGTAMVALLARPAFADKALDVQMLQTAASIENLAVATDDTALALDLENVAAATYLAAIDVVKDPAGIRTAASIEPVELQHAAILSFLLGQYPVPDSFSKRSGARPASDMIG